MSVRDGGNSREIVLFTVGDITCGVDICSVHEIKRVAGITVVYGVAEDVSGVINLRGQIVSVLDLRIRFGYSIEEPTGEERIMIVPFGEEAVGLLVDSVEDAVVLNTDQLLPVPPNLASGLAHYFTAVYQWDSRIVALVDLNELVAIINSTSGTI